METLPKVHCGDQFGPCFDAKSRGIEASYIVSKRNILSLVSGDRVDPTFSVQAVLQSLGRWPVNEAVVI